MSLDSLIYKLAFVAFLIAIIKRDDALPAFIICLSYIATDLIYIKSPTMEEIALYSFHHAIKDFVFAVAMFLIYKPAAFVLALTFIASCLFHKCAQVQANNHVLDLLRIRTDFMTYITAFQIATIYTAIIKSGGGNGGKRVRYFISCVRNSDFRILRKKTFKALL